MSKKQTLGNEIQEVSKTLLTRLTNIQKDVQSVQSLLKNNETAVRQKLMQQEKEKLAKQEALFRQEQEAAAAAQAASAEQTAETAKPAETSAKTKKEKAKEHPPADSEPDNTQKAKEQPEDKSDTAKADKGEAVKVPEIAVNSSVSVKKPETVVTEKPVNKTENIPQTEIKQDRPQIDRTQPDRAPAARPQGTGTSTYRNDRPQGGYDRPQGTSTYRNDRPQGGYDRPQGTSTYRNDRPQGTGTSTYRNDRPQGDRSQGGYAARPQGTGTSTYRNDRPQGDRPQGGYDRPQGGYTPRPQGGYTARPQGQGSYAARPQGDRPQGSYTPRPQGDRPQGGYTARPQGQGGYTPRPQGDRPQGGYAARPQGGRPQTGSFGARSQGPKIPASDGPSEKERVSNYDPNKKLYSRNNYDTEKKTPTKRDIVKQKSKGFDEDDDNVRVRKLKRKESAQVHMDPIKIDNAVMTAENITLKDLSEKLGKPVSALIKKLFLIGVMATINDEIDYDTAALIATDFNINLEYKPAKTFEETMTDADEANESDNNEDRPPIVTIMGHVDHGKTSLLDVIRETNVTAHEAGGITQHIGAYTVNHNGRSITFLDTPGHEAFTSMRARGAQVTDIAILVVAADDGVMPQTIEAINHAQAAKVPIIVAINKMDKPTANPDRVKQELTNHGIVPEEWGGDAIIVPVSAIAKTGIEDLLEMILVVADVNQYKANSQKNAKGAIIEARIDKSRGPVATVLIQNGTLKVGDTIVAGTTFGRVRAMIDDKGSRLETAGPSIPVEVLGFNDVPEAGDIMYATEDDKLSRQVAQERKNTIKAAQVKTKSKTSLDDLFNQIQDGSVKELNIIIKADVQGSAEAVKQALNKLSNDKVRINVIHAAVGAVKESDVVLAYASSAIIIGFNVRPDSAATAAAERDGVDMRMYRIIYNAIDDIELAMKGMLDPEFREVVIGHAQVRSLFKVPGVGMVAGAYVTDGKIQRNAKIRLLRDNIVVHEGEIESLKRFKDDAKEVAEGYECGIGIASYNDLKENDVIEAFISEQIKVK